MRIKVSDYVANVLAAHDIRHIFAISGAGNAHLLDSIAYHPALSYVCPHHEQAGVMAAAAYSRRSGRLGAMLTTAGPGAANAITGVLDAWADSIPCLIISGQEKSMYANPSIRLRMWGVQGFDIVRAVGGITKYAAIVDRPESIRYHLEKALHICRGGRPGPVWLDIPIDVQAAKIDSDALEGFTPEVDVKVDIAPAVDEIAKYYSRSRRPVFWLGHGIRLAGAESLVPALMERFPAAYLTAWNGSDLVPWDHPLHFGHAGVYGQRCANFVVQNCDLVVAIGTRLAIPQVGYRRDEFARAAVKIMVDVDEAEIEKLQGTLTLGVKSDAGEFLRAFLSHRSDETSDCSDWLAQCGDWKARYPVVEADAHRTEPGFVNSYRFIDRLSDHLSDTETVVTDAGTACTCTHQAIRLRAGQRLIYSTGLGEMGFGLPGAIGACFAQDKQRVVLITGDGSIMLNLQELQTVVHHSLPIKIFLFCNDAYLSIKHTQTALFGRLAGADPATGVSCPDFLKIGAAFGLRTCRLTDWADADRTIETVLNGPDAVLCEVPMHPMQRLVPKLSLRITSDGQLVSPPLEDLDPPLSRERLRKEMSIGLHPKSEEPTRSGSDHKRG